VTTVNSLKRNS